MARKRKPRDEPASFPRSGSKTAPKTIEMVDEPEQGNGKSNLFFCVELNMILIGTPPHLLSYQRKQ